MLSNHDLTNSHLHTANKNDAFQILIGNTTKCAMEHFSEFIRHLFSCNRTQSETGTSSSAVVDS